jgi:hypothetical protein
MESLPTKSAAVGSAASGLIKLSTDLPDSWLARFIVNVLKDVDIHGVGIVASGSTMIAEDFINLYNAAGEEARCVLALMRAANGDSIPLRDYAGMPTLTMEAHAHDTGPVVAALESR